MALPERHPLDPLTVRGKRVGPAAHQPLGLLCSFQKPKARAKTRVTEPKAAMSPHLVTVGLSKLDLGGTFVHIEARAPYAVHKNYWVKQNFGVLKFISWI
jgi:hypothetical protein